MRIIEDNHYKIAISDTWASGISLSSATNILSMVLDGHLSSPRPTLHSCAWETAFPINTFIKHASYGTIYMLRPMVSTNGKDGKG